MTAADRIAAMASEADCELAKPVPIDMPVSILIGADNTVHHMVLASGEKVQVNGAQATIIVGTELCEIRPDALVTTLQAVGILPPGPLRAGRYVLERIERAPPAPNYIFRRPGR